jgi:hypothetical protein
LERDALGLFADVSSTSGRQAASLAVFAHRGCQGSVKLVRLDLACPSRQQVIDGTAPQRRWILRPCEARAARLFGFLALDMCLAAAVENGPVELIWCAQCEDLLTGKSFLISFGRKK